eukprot:7132227-Lingulodinium_polyedra.AAC.1
MDWCQRWPWILRPMEARQASAKFYSAMRKRKVNTRVRVQAQYGARGRISMFDVRASRPQRLADWEPDKG